MGSRARGLQQLWLRAQEHRLSSRGARALLLRGMWDLQDTAIKPVSPVSAGEFFTTEPPGKPRTFFPSGRCTLSFNN